MCFNRKHDDLIDAKLPPLVDQINSLSDQLNKGTSLESFCVTALNQWRDNAHRTVDQFYERKRQQFEELIQEKRNRQKQEVIHVGSNVSELIRGHEATKEQIDSITDYVRILEQDINKFEQNQFIFTPLVIDDSLILIRQDAASHWLLSSTANSGDSILSSDNHPSTRQKRNIGTTDNIFSKSMKPNRWEIEEQATGITDTMRVNILSIISTTMDTHDRSATKEVARDVKNWLDETYGKSWMVEIYDKHEHQPHRNITSSKYFQVKDTKFGWTILIFK
ncbi:unnamed protein product [Rotaria magnacalcarata]|uniref:Uncharacterized protein n=2 Tax=Rotaria magnacalcarata TaxID=392030 RepID=A0A8S2R548_9BILA|nr:unnamed protein product [Rotaria magnacalcarata]